LNTIKTIIGELPFLGDLAVWVNHRIKGTWKTNPAYWISKIVPATTAQIVQIGSNDGAGGDPLKRLLKTRLKWRALLVEPVPHLFARLKANYGNSERFIFENAAINEGRNAQFFWLDETAKQAVPTLPPWYDQLGSFDRNHILKHFPQLDLFIQETAITGLTLADLFSKHQINHIDVLHIDTEGYDFRILSQLNLKKVRPTIILYEHQHLCPAEKHASVSFLKTDYDVFEWGADMFAVSKLVGEKIRSSLAPLERYRANNQ